MYLVVCNNTKKRIFMGARENKYQTIFTLSTSYTYILEFYMCFHNSCEV